MYADLHCHSIFSDGTNTTSELIEIAVKNNIEVIPGVEISTSVNGIRIHILGYYINYKSHKLINFFDEVCKIRTNNAKLIFDKLCKSGKLKYSWDNVLEFNKGKTWLCSSHVLKL